LILFLLTFLGLISWAGGSPVLAKYDGTWMIDIKSFAESEGLKTNWQPIEKHFTAKNEKLECSFVLGFPYIFANGKATTLDQPTRLENGKIWTSAEATLNIFEVALAKKYAPDTLKKIIKDVTPKEAQINRPAPPKKEPAGTREVQTIIIDPGHGGKDPGASGRISQEKEIVLAVAKKLKKELSEEGFNVKLTRDKDVFIELSERPNLANQWDGDLFISLHCNAVDGVERQKRTEGYRFYVLRDPENEEDKAIARRENKVITLYGDKDSKDEISPLEWFKIEARLEKYKQNSYKFTEQLLIHFDNGKIKKLGSGAGGAGFMVLVGAFMPAVLVELGFISNPEDEKYMNTEKGQEDLAARISQSVQDYKKAVEEYRKTLQHEK